MFEELLHRFEVIDYSSFRGYLIHFQTSVGFSKDMKMLIILTEVFLCISYFPGFWGVGGKEET